MQILLDHQKQKQKNGLQKDTNLTQGRDVYIWHNNGGAMKCSTYLDRESRPSSSFRQKRQYFKQMPIMKGKIKCYVPNGTGRDSYVHNSSGGFIASYIPGRKLQFAGGLRNYENSQDHFPFSRPSSRSKSPPYQQQLSRLNFSRENQIKLRQSLSVKRLSLPKQSGLSQQRFIPQFLIDQQQLKNLNRIAQLDQSIQEEKHKLNESFKVAEINSKIATNSVGSSPKIVQDRLQKSDIKIQKIKKLSQNIQNFNSGNKRSNTARDYKLINGQKDNL